MDEEINRITNTIYLGNMYAASNKKKLKELGIKKILTVMSNCDNEYNPKTFIHKTIEVDDDFNTNLIKYFKECFDFIEGDDKVFVHCAAGMSRSPTIVIAYLMWKKKIFLDQALTLVKNKRPEVSPNYNFMEQLKKFETILIDNDYDISKINFNKISASDKKCLIY